MLQSRLVSPGTIDIIDVKTPSPKKGELLIRVKAALTCGTDLKAYQRGHPVIPMPGPFGHEFSGIVHKAGSGVEGFKEGDPVMAVHSAPCLKCGYCRKGLHNLCENIMQSKVMGAFSEYVLLPAHIVAQNAYKKPRSLGFQDAALLEPLSCVVHSIRRLIIKPYDKVLIIGAGPIGLLHSMLFKRLKAEAAISDINPERLAFAKKTVKCRIVGSSDDEIHSSLPDGMGYDFVIECTGRPDVWEKSANYVRRGGTVVLFGGCPSGTHVTFDTHRLHYDEITLSGCFHFTPGDVKAAYSYLRSGAIDSDALISGSHPLCDIQKAFDALSQGRGMKYAIIP